MMKWSYGKGLVILWMLLFLAACGVRDVASTQDRASPFALSTSLASEQSSTSASTELSMTATYPPKPTLDVSNKPEPPTVAPTQSSTSAPTVPSMTATYPPKPTLDSSNKPEPPTMSKQVSSTTIGITPQANVSSGEPTLTTSITNQPEQPNTSPLESPVVVTLADNHRTITIAVGGTLHFQLDSTFEWRFMVGNEQILTPVTSADSAVSGNMSYIARSVGQTTVDAVGSPPCAKSHPPCRAPSTAFSVDVVVR